MKAGWGSLSVAELEKRGWLLVEDGNHGEYRPRPQEFGAGSTAFIRAADIENGRVLFSRADRINDVALARIRKGRGKGGDILFSHKGTVGKLALVPLTAPPFVCSPQTTFWRTLDEESLDRRFLYYFMQSREFNNQWRARKGETDMADYVSLTAQRQLRVNFPGIDEQRAIGGTLGALDDKIERNRQTNETLEALARAIFKSWFVDFDPVVAKTAGRQPFGMNAETAVLFPDRFVESERGPIPEGWRAASIYEAADVRYGAPFASSFFSTEGRGWPLIRIRDLSNHEPEVFTDQVHRKGHRVRAGDIIVGMDGEFRAHLWRGPEAWLNQRLCQFVPKSGYGTAFVYQSILEPLAEFERSKVGTTVIHLGKADIDTFRIVVPSQSVLSRFTTLADPMVELVTRAGLESRALSAVRDLLLPRLLTSELRVRQAEKAVGAVL